MGAVYISPLVFAHDVCFEVGVKGAGDVTMIVGVPHTALLRTFFGVPIVAISGGNIVTKPWWSICGLDVHAATV